MKLHAMSSDTLNRLVNEIDHEIEELRIDERLTGYKSNKTNQFDIPVHLKNRVMDYVSSFEPLWNQFTESLHSELCEEKGYLNQQWKQWKEFQTSDVAKYTYSAMIASGVAKESLGPLTVLLSTIVINSVINQGLQAFCSRYEGS